MEFSINISSTQQELTGETKKFYSNHDNTIVIKIDSLEGIEKIIFEQRSGKCRVFRFDDELYERYDQAFADMNATALQDWLYDHGFTNNPCSLTYWMTLGTVQEIINCAIEDLWPGHPESKFTGMSKEKFASWIRKAGYGKIIVEDEIGPVYKVLPIIDSAIAEIKEERKSS